MRNKERFKVRSFKTDFLISFYFRLEKINMSDLVSKGKKPGEADRHKTIEKMVASEIAWIRIGIMDPKDASFNISEEALNSFESKPNRKAEILFVLILIICIIIAISLFVYFSKR